MHRLLLEDAPERYALSFDAETPAIRVTADQSAAEFVSDYIKRHPKCTDLFPDALKLPEFVPLTEEPWGVGRRIQTTMDDNAGTVVWSCALPPAVPAPKHRSTDGTAPNHKATYEVSASLQVLLLLFSEYTPPRTRRPQIAHTSLYLRGGTVYGAPLSAVMSHMARTGLQKACAEDKRNEMEDVTRQAIERSLETMLGWSGDLLTMSCRTIFEQDGRIMLMTFGSATDLSTDVMNMDMPGVELTPHNTDAPCQQLSLLSGFAALCDALRPYVPDLPTGE